MLPAGDRIQQARDILESLLNDLETTALPVSQHLMKAMRAARLLRDGDAQGWLAFEISGYPADFYADRLGTCRKYAVVGGRILETGEYWLHSLPHAEAQALAYDRSIQALGSGPSIAPVADYVAGGATMRVIDRYNEHLALQRNEYIKAVAFVASMKTALHSFATDSFLALEFGSMVEDLFGAARSSVDAFVRANCPRAAEALLSINERLSAGDPESRSAALNSCRRLLQAVADSVFPPQGTPYVDSSGKSHDVDAPQYKNRIMAYFDSRVRSKTTASLLTSELTHLSARLESVYEKACKGVHDDVSTEEARLAVMGTYMILAEVTRLESSATGPAVA